MSDTAQITVFSKPNCSYCDSVKNVLRAENLAFDEFDITDSSRAANASIYLSGTGTVPQIFIGRTHVNGAADFLPLANSGRLKDLLKAHASEQFSFDGLSDATLEKGAHDTKLKDYIPASIGTHSDTPDEWPLLRFYSIFFGFWPDCFKYMRHWQEIYKLFIYCHNMSAVRMSREIIGEGMLYVAAFSTSNAHGCDYCQVHAASTGKDYSVNIIKDYKAAREGYFKDDTEIGPFEVALADVAAACTTNTVTDELLDRVRSLEHLSRASIKSPVEQCITSMAMVAGSFGYLNPFNDLTGLEVEGGWMKMGEEVGLGSGRHGATEGNPDNLSHDIPDGGPSIEELFAKFDAEVGDVEAFAMENFGHVPEWFHVFPEQIRRRHAYLYAETFSPRDHALLPSELRHLMARVAATERNHDYIALSEACSAMHVTDDPSRTMQRIKACYAAASGELEDDALFDGAEIAALKLAWLSAQMPLMVPYNMVEGALEHYNHTELVHLITTAGIAGVTQRVASLSRPKIEGDLAKFAKEHDLETDTLKIRYPV
ncbi:glutaredoxin domain-containing protein [Novosphingopyxis sp.]|uniref:glutaredoxin domain-containing protein n=1 Tax=Novosphingopyxis sp. TaxID=2709690 RepID=UPI003B5B83EA